VTELKQELNRVCEAAASDKKKLEDELKEENRKNLEVDRLLTTVSTGKANCCTTLSLLYLVQLRVALHNSLYIVDFYRQKTTPIMIS
jgi:hypothetical protein